MSLPPFANEPILELRRAGPRQALLDALAAVDARLPLRVPVLVGSEARAGDALTSTDPGDPERVVAHAAAATAADVDAALDAAARGFARWRAVPAAERAAALLRAAAWLRDRRTEVAALEVRECAKPWPEADADVCEAIDFLEYYARGAIALEEGRPLLQVPGEHNELRYVPRGVTAVIAPWNFPVAIPMGMTAAALAAGNAAVLKPAEQSPACGHVVVQALRAGGVPDEAVALLPGDGSAGAALARDPRVQTIAFTGSAPVGLEILRTAADTREGQRHLKRVVAELGGKNCVLVDSDADLDEAVPGIVHSAFDYAGQKCSAAARVLVHEAIADALIERLSGAVEALETGQAGTFGTDVPPVIEREAQERVDRYAQRAAADGRIVARGERPPGGWFCAPVVAADLDPGSPVLREEIFGPVLAVDRVRDMDAAVAAVQSLPFALTGGLYARNPRTVEAVAAQLPVGNLYVNRSTTGAMVGRQPFGGNRLSGTGTKAGGPDYLLSFVEPRVITHNTVRHGLVV
ncbi:aldehyde dehydrogenase family protein [Capillimicrobium parvum]|uniref:L-glutamate gamma-semialdehyde dehydrogenase n=1 Tax=Capillimicrobium parvum TaxID=2884022 RepID=A0A9E6XZW3_9ACTN|nr:aldehyde dehydrogenase family protein [Capillimicrobium parvum]UGS36846.1 1-pyrroline-5-carboxylate dehydrogenase 2 [Capillimicrobium parvum]